MPRKVGEGEARQGLFFGPQEISKRRSEIEERVVLRAASQKRTLREVNVWKEKYTVPFETNTMDHVSSSRFPSFNTPQAPSVLRNKLNLACLGSRIAVG